MRQTNYVVMSIALTKLHVKGNSFIPPINPVYNSNLINLIVVTFHQINVIAPPPPQCGTPASKSGRNMDDSRR